MTILVTGTSRGIGLEIANYYLTKNFSIIGISRSLGVISHKNYSHYLCDLTDENSLTETIKIIKKNHKQIDVLINNAGIASMNPILFTKYEMVEKIFKTNFFSAFLLTREISKVMMRNNFGRIVNFSTIAVALDLEGESIYASSKAALESFTRISSKELSEYNITVNAIGPSPIATNLIASISSEKINALLDKQSIKRLGTFDDVINVIDFFISKKSSNITGQTIYMGGVM
jgi:3-oxoacyl-[acyl-carrier protein] reductase